MWWQNIKIIYSSSLSARHNPTCSAREQAVKHSATLTCKSIFISSPVAKNRSFFIEVSKAVWNMYQQSYRGEVQVSRAWQLQTSSSLCIRIQGQKNTHCLSTVPYFYGSWARQQQKKPGTGFQKACVSLCFYGSSTAWGTLGKIWIAWVQYAWHSLYLHLRFWTLCGPQAQLLSLHAGSCLFFPLPSFWARRSRRKRKPVAVIRCLYICAAFIEFYMH